VVVQWEQQVQALVVLVVLVISLQAAQVHQEQEHLSVVVAVEQDLLALAQTHPLMLAVTAAQVAAAVVVHPH
jgi:hypothetical protein